MIKLVLFLFSVAAVSAETQQPTGAAPSPLTRAEMEEFLRNAAIGPDRHPPIRQRAWRALLDDGKLKHYAGIKMEDGSRNEWDYRGDVAAYELDKLLELNMVPVVVKRIVNGQPAAVVWWVDNVAMMERDRRNKNIEPPDPDRWNKQMQAVRLFDELVSNMYRDDPSAPWIELLITRDWRIWLVDYTGSFRARKHLVHAENLVQCDRALLRRLRELNRQTLQQKMGAFLTTEQLDALDARRQLLVKHFDDLIRSKGEAAVLYDLPAGR